MARYCLRHKNSSFVVWDDYSCLEDAIEATTEGKHKDKVVKIFEDTAFGGYVGYFYNGEEIKGESS